MAYSRACATQASAAPRAPHEMPYLAWLGLGLGLELGLGLGLGSYYYYYYRDTTTLGEGPYY